MNIKKTFILSEHALTSVINQIKDDQWSLEVPKEISPKGETLKTIVNYHAYDDAWVPDILAEKTIQEVGTKYDGDLLSDTPKENCNKIVSHTIATVENYSDLDKKVHLSYGDFTAGEYLQHITTFRAFRAVTIARFIGVDDTLPDLLLQGLWEILVPSVEEWRKMGVFGPKIQVAETANLQSRLLGLVGIQPMA